MKAHTSSTCVVKANTCCFKWFFTASDASPSSPPFAASPSPSSFICAPTETGSGGLPSLIFPPDPMLSPPSHITHFIKMRTTAATHQQHSSWVLTGLKNSNLDWDPQCKSALKNSPTLSISFSSHRSNTPGLALAAAIAVAAACCGGGGGGGGVGRVSSATAFVPPALVFACIFKQSSGALKALGDRWFEPKHKIQNQLLPKTQNHITNTDENIYKPKIANHQHSNFKPTILLHAFFMHSST